MQQLEAGAQNESIPRKILRRIWNETFLFTLVAIAIGFIIGAVILLITGFNPGEAYKLLYNGIFSTPKYRMYSLQ